MEGDIEFLQDRPYPRDSTENSVSRPNESYNESNKEQISNFAKKSGVKASKAINGNGKVNKSLDLGNNEKIIDFYEKMNDELSSEMIENTAILFSCVGSYMGDYMAIETHDTTQEKVLKKCLLGGKMNYPDLFLRFID